MRLKLSKFRGVTLRPFIAADSDAGDEVGGVVDHGVVDPWPLRVKSVTNTGLGRMPTFSLMTLPVKANCSELTVVGLATQVPVGGGLLVPGMWRS